MHYRVLGPLSPTSASMQQRLLLSCLLVDANRFVSAERLVQLLWGGRMPADAAAALRTQVARLRRRLPSGALATQPGGYRLTVAADELDSAVFERFLGEGKIAAALALWRGRAFEEFEDWPFARVEAARLEQLRLQTWERQARVFLEQGNVEGAATLAEALLAGHPERESMRAVLMAALYRSGRQAAALEVYRSWRRELVDEYGLEPTPALAQLQQDILRHRLPIAPLNRPVDSFLGRDEDISAIRRLLSAARLVTLTGPGGVGKTRLAVEVAAAAVDKYPDGVTLCDVGAVGDPHAVIQAVGRTLGLIGLAGNRAEDQLITHLSGRRMLLVLDGCERVLGAAAALASEVINRSEGITVLATSRERLAVAGEHVQPVPPLPADVSVRLFRDRSRAVSAGAAVSDEGVADVCSRLDGLPLAIELAAARVGTLRVEHMVSALDDRFAVLADRRRSLAATLQWSYDVLTDVERDALCRLSAFAGTFDREAAIGLGVDTGVLLRLADKSLVDGANPYRLLDSVRDYARAQLRDQNRREELTQGHAQWALELAVTAAANLSTHDEQHWAQRLDLHFGELRAAQEWQLAHQPGQAVELLTALRTWALWRGATEVFHWADAVAAVTEHPTAVAVAATGAWQRGELPRAAALAREALPHRWAFEALAEEAFLTGHLAEARRRYRDAADLAIAAGDGLQEMWCLGSVALAGVYAGENPGADLDTLLGRAEALGSPSARAMAHFVAGESQGSIESLLEAITLAEEVGSRFISGLARTALASRISSADPATALRHYAAAIEQWRNAAAWPAYWVTLRTLIVLMTELGAHEQAATLYGANLKAAHASPAFGRDAALLETAATRLQGALGIDQFAALQGHGATLGEDESANYALAAIKATHTRMASGGCQ